MFSEAGALDERLGQEPLFGTLLQAHDTPEISARK
jgi:hypothetical protein